MENLEALKLELISQKVTIENKGGTVTVANSNPSPREITEGIKTISIPDFSSANATTEDVVSGKTFYAGDKSLKVGTKVVPDLTIADAKEEDVILGKTFYAGNNTIKTGSKELPKLDEATATVEDVVSGKTFFSGDDVIKTGTKQIADLSQATATPEDVISGKTFYAGTQELKVGTGVNNSLTYEKIFISEDNSSSGPFYVTLPSGIKKLRRYIMYYNSSVVEFNFNSDIEEIGDYAFINCVNTTFPNFASLQKIRRLGQYSFHSLSQSPIDLSLLPYSITYIGARCFNNSMAANSSIVLNSPIKDLGSYSFASTNKKEMNNFIVADDIASTTLPGYMIENLMFNCDFRIPATVKSLASSFAYGASFNNITIPATCTTIGNGAFYMKTTDSVSYRRLQTVTFESETPPTFSTYSFAQQDITNGFKIYVPDNAVDVYKSVSNLAQFTNCIYPVSQKP